MTDTPAERAETWWHGMQPAGTRPGDPGALARLRRASTPLEAAAEAATIRLYRALPGGDRFDEDRMARVAVLAAVLATVRADRRGRFGGFATHLGSGDRPRLSQARLSRLLAVRTETEALRGFREAVGLLGGVADVRDVTRTVLGWTDPDWATRTRARFVYHYHGADAPTGDPA